jgi:tyrosine-protein phosphatase YwqE
MRFDIHTHILPAIDDGARSIGSTARMFQLAAASGTTHIVATPHFTCEIAGNQVEEIKNKFNERNRSTISPKFTADLSEVLCLLSFKKVGENENTCNKRKRCGQKAR